ncbi:lipopolysaccharide biosynthesis protein RfbH [uncultured Tyzzerella sp.]|uniref:lipopolysaccharide biosynthesis protein RfbH n=1 Tax=uncultured Tyzzerella sp. TaxID=2321398 RepID=UPI0029423229|nr:lipopolysaccharide biosynthesis protein RfbH [uncultured Tyzzerella sp.]
MKYNNEEEQLKLEIFEKVKQYYNLSKNNEKDKKQINYAGRVYDEEEMLNLIDSSLEFWLTSGRYTEQFEKDLSRFLNVKYSLLVNSGSSANLLAFMALTSDKLGDRKIGRGDEIITVAAGFPTTIAPIIQYGAIPVFLDISIPKYNIEINDLEKALTEKTKAIMIAHTLGNPFNLKKIKEFCEKNNLWLIEDNCDALGSKYIYNNEEKYTGTIGDIGTSSFYPPHHITMGEGGAVYTNNLELKRILQSMRDWGRDCWCSSGKDNTCKNRFSKQFGQLPLGYDHKYVYSHFGYNLKVTDMQASIGVAQLKKLPKFIEARRKNWEYIKENLKNLEKYFILPEAEENSIPSWFGFILTIRDNTKFTRNEIVEYLESNNIQTRMLFSGNIINHPCFDEMRNNNYGYRVIGELKNTNKIMNDTFWVGVYPGLTKKDLDYMISKIKDFIHKIEVDK